MTARLGVFISGSGRSLLNLADRCDDGSLDARIALVLASRECPGADKARARNLPTLVVPRNLGGDELLALVRAHDLRLIVLAGYLRKLPVPGELQGRIVNIHPALLPGDGSPGPFGGQGLHGLHVHRAVLAAGVAESGCSVHLVTADYDAGPVILTRRCPVLPGDTPESLAARVFEQELLALPEALQRLLDQPGIPPKPPA